MTRVDQRLSESAPQVHYRTTTLTRPSAAREKILETADRLFYEHGVHAVGVERLIAEAGVTRVTFYRHFPSKDELIEAYLRRRGDRLRDRIASAFAETPYDPWGVLDALAKSLVEASGTEGYRGCEFVNAAAEFSEETHPAQALGVDQRAWLASVAADALRDLGHPQPERLARKLMMLRTGGTVVLGLDSYDDSAELFLEAWNAILGAELERPAGR